MIFYILIPIFEEDFKLMKVENNKEKIKEHKKK